MSFSSSPKDWDFARAIQLIRRRKEARSNEGNDQDTKPPCGQPNPPSRRTEAGRTTVTTSLGDFDYLFSQNVLAKTFYRDKIPSNGGLKYDSEPDFSLLGKAEARNHRQRTSSHPPKQARAAKLNPKFLSSHESNRPANSNSIPVEGGEVKENEDVAEENASDQAETPRGNYSGRDNGNSSAVRREIVAKLLDLPRVKEESGAENAVESSQTNIDELDFNPALSKQLRYLFPQEAGFLDDLEKNKSFVAEGHPTGIHVFIDMSNILIGFYDTLKKKRGVPKDARMPLGHMSFSRLAAILERGRSAAKRVLVGSDDIELVQEAQELGYETNILERVAKSSIDDAIGKKLQKNSPSKPLKLGPFRMVEQGVDEVLHLKILESILDTETPSTIVLATGDAAESDYSGGFMKMLERGLVRGWQVEVAAFRENTSSAYNRPDWLRKWEKQFRIIELDPFAEVIRTRPPKQFH